MLKTSVLLASIATVALANDNGLGRLPPQGWRSWNLYGANVNQELIQSIMDGMVKKIGMVDGKMSSFCDLGYCDVGLDDNWQVADAGNPPMHYHGADGSPMVNTKLFPSFQKMTSHAHSLGLTSGWYGNNCIHSDHCRNTTECEMQIRGDVAAMRKFGFDSWKLDGCGGELDLVYFNKIIEETAPTTGRKDIMIENCHWGPRGPKPNTPDPNQPAAEGCPFNFYRSSGDVRASFSSIMGNLQSVDFYSAKNLSYPGCWAYPDMLQVGCAHGPGGKNDPGLTPAETRVHFYSWCAVSSPLTLSHDVTNQTINDAIWPVVANTEALKVSQTYAGFSGGTFSTSGPMINFVDEFADEPISAATQTSIYKPMSYKGDFAIVLINSGDASATLTLNFADVPGVKAMGVTKFTVRDLHNHKDLGTFSNTWSGPVDTHDCTFLWISPAPSTVASE